MNNEARISIAVITGIVVIVVMIFTSSMFKSHNIARMVEAGANPITAKCAIDPPDDRSICALPTIEKANAQAASSKDALNNAENASSSK